MGDEHEQVLILQHESIPLHDAQYVSTLDTGSIPEITMVQSLQARWLRAVKKDAHTLKQWMCNTPPTSCLEFAPPEVCSDPDIILAAVQCNGYALRYAAPALQSDHQI